MTNYRRVHVPGASCFFTVNLARRDTTLLTERIDDLRNAVRYVRARQLFVIDAMVVLPEHLHAVWTLPVGDADHSLRWRLVKTWFSRQIPHGERRRDSRIGKGERAIWQRRYWEHLIRDDDDLGRKRPATPPVQQHRILIRYAPVLTGAYAWVSRRHCGNHTSMAGATVA